MTLDGEIVEKHIKAQFVGSFVYFNQWRLFVLCLNIIGVIRKQNYVWFSSNMIKFPNKVISWAISFIHCLLLHEPFLFSILFINTIFRYRNFGSALVLYLLCSPSVGPLFTNSYCGPICTLKMVMLEALQMWIEDIWI